MKLCKCGCGTLMEELDDRGRIHNYIHGHNRKGIKLTKIHKNVLISSNTGRKMPNNVKKALLKYNLGCKHTKEHNIKISNKLKGIKQQPLSLSHKIKISMSNTGEKIFSGFKTKANRLLRNSLNFKQWRNEIFERDDYTCKNLNCEYCENKRGVELHPHHIKHFSKFEELRFNMENGITYCADFHLKSGLHGGK